MRHRELPYISFYKLPDVLRPHIMYQGGIYRRIKDEHHMDDSKTGVRITHGSSARELAIKLNSPFEYQKSPQPESYVEDVQNFWNMPPEGACPEGWVPLSSSEELAFFEALGINPAEVQLHEKL